MLVRRLWGKHIAGPFFALLAVILPLIGLFCHSSPTVTIWLGATPLILAVLFIWPAQYQVWKSERGLLAQEQGKALRPELKGSVHHVRVSPIDDGLVINFDGSLCNQRDQQTTADIRVKLRKKSGEAYVESANATQPGQASNFDLYNFPPPIHFSAVKLECGITQSFSAAAFFANVAPRDLAIKSIECFAEDGFNQSHALSIIGEIRDVLGAVGLSP